MSQDRLLHETRWRLALLFASGLGLVAIACHWLAYQAIARSYRASIDRELRSVAGTLHDTLEPQLAAPGEFSPTTRRLLPGLCLVDAYCDQLASHHHISGVLHQEPYYVCFFDREHRLVAFLGEPPPGRLVARRQPTWRTATASNGRRYREMSFHLHTQELHPWGFMRVGRYLDDMERALQQVRLHLLGSGLLGLGAIAALGWWLAGLAIRPMERSYAQMQQFTTDAAHELRTPLAALRAAAEAALVQPEDAGELRASWQAVLRQTQHLTRLAADLLMLSRLDRAYPSGARAAVLLNEVVSDLAEEFAALALQQGLELRANPLATEPRVWANRDQLYRLASNLLANALHYTPAGGWVEIGADWDGGRQQVLLYVRDTGAGIAPAEQEKIFDRFYRGGNQSAATAGGFGLGLAIAWGIARAHRGSLGVESEVGRGSTFVLRLPLHSWAG